MANYTLAPNEGIIISYTGIRHNRKTAEIVLTNKNLICVEQSGLFKTTYSEMKYPVDLIKVIDGKAQVDVFKDGDNVVLRVLFKNGEERFEFPTDTIYYFKKKAEADKLANEISLLLTENGVEKTEGALASGVKNVLDGLGINISKKPNNKIVHGKCIGCMAPVSGTKGQKIKCKYCDTEQVL